MCRVVVLLGIGVTVLAAPVGAEDCLEPVGTLTLPVFAWRVAVSGGYAYLAEWERGLRAIDVSTPSAPVEVGWLDVSAPWDIAVSGDYAYVASGNRDFPLDEPGLIVIDVSTPSAPIAVGFFETPGQALGVAVSDGYAYVAAFDSGLRVIDVSTPSAPVEVGWLEIEDGSPEDVAVSGSFAYVVNHTYTWGRLDVIDVSTPSAPVGVGFVSPQGHYSFSAVAVSGSYAYVGKEQGLLMIDVSTPSAPVVVGEGGLPYEGLYVRNIAVSGDYAYCSWVAFPGATGFTVFDVSTPSTYLPERAELDDGGGGVAVSGGYVYLGYLENKSVGLGIYTECPVFTDGFESGDTSAWSATVP
jgi:hypothetical protein